ncbi:sensor histidine kinase [Proteinivorax hydrogeniformans]|uniref:histidine kinase n=1 Tax=Proteinivorax hydrogeniformans TaxID=1826727 RepID=A0AAU8HVU9_9FIRM
MLPQQFVLLYLVYGFAFVNLGISALQQSSKLNSNFAFVNNIKYLGYFGVAHGITEFVTMLTWTGLYNDYYLQMFVFNSLLKAVSFVALFLFGANLLAPKFKRYFSFYISTVFSVWLMIFIFLGVRHGFVQHIDQPIYNIIFIRYFMAFPAGVITCIALLTDASAIRKSKIYKIAIKYRALAIAFLVYGLLDGLIVGYHDFFPANLINNDMFMEVFGFPVQVAKTLTGITINLLFLRIIYIFNWERDEKLQQLNQSKLVNDERRKLGREIHDNVIQDLFATGLQVEFAIKKEDDDLQQKLLLDIKKSINHSISSIRKFMIRDSSKVIDVEEFNENVKMLVEQFDKIIDAKVSFAYRIPDYNLGKLTKDTATQIYYIIQEGLSNVAKHSEASKVEILLTSSINTLEVRIMDNGIGFTMSETSSKNIGLNSMKQRAKQISGSFQINSEKNTGTEILISIPWGNISEQN